MLTDFKIVGSKFIVSLAIGCGMLMLVACGGGEKESGSPGFYISSSNPDNGLGSVSVNTKIEIGFSQPIDTSTVNIKTFSLLDSHSHEPVRGSFKFYENNSGFSFTPRSLLFDRHYKVIVHHNITNMTGVHLGHESKEWSFLTEPEPPRFDYQPKFNATDVSTKTVIRVVFQKDLAPGSISNFNFQLTDSNGELVSAVASGVGRRAILTPTQPLNIASVYSVSLATTILDSDNIPMFDFPVSWNFTTQLDVSSTIHLGTDGNDSASAVVVDNLNNIYVSGQTDGALPGAISIGADDGFILQLNQQNIANWYAQFGTAGFDKITDMTIDSSGSKLFLSGNSGSDRARGGDGKSDISVYSFDTSGNELWRKSFGDANEHDQSNGIVTDASNNVYVVGSTKGVVSGFSNFGNHDIVLAKYDANGNNAWIKQYGTAGDDVVANIAVFGDTAYAAVTNNNIIDGPVFPPGPPPPGLPPILNPDSTAMVYAIDTLTGDKRWDAQINNTIIHELLDVQSDTTGNIYVFGSTEDRSKDLAFHVGFISKINSLDGSEIQKIQLDLVDIYEPHAMLIRDDSIYVAGLIDNFLFSQFPGEGVGGFPFEGPPYTLVIKKLSLDGVETWSTKVKIEHHVMDIGLAVNSLSEVIATGTAHGGVDGNTLIGGRSDAFVLKMDAFTGKLK